MSPVDDPTIHTCCHWGTGFTETAVSFGDDDHILGLSGGVYATIREALDDYGVPYDVVTGNKIVVNPGELTLPTTFGVGTEHDGDGDDGLDNDYIPPEDMPSIEEWVYI